MATSTKVPKSARDFADRAWLAYLALPRDQRAKPPKKTVLEREHRIGRGTLGRVFSGERTHVELATVEKIAAALQTSTAWLLHGIGEAPVPLQPIIQREIFFDENKNPIPLAGVYGDLLPKSGSAYDTALFPEDDIVYLRSSRGAAEMKQLPDEVRRAVLGIVHVLGYPLEEVVRAADRARARYGSAPLSPELWYGAIKEVLISGDDGSSQPPHQPSAPS